MAAAGDVQVAEDGGLSYIKLHPYLVALIRWCVSSFWSTATLVLHRLITTPLPPATGNVPAPKPPKPRPASSDHLHPEPRVECMVLHQPAHPTVDVIFVHGLYGSLANTWRQGEWRPKYSTNPSKVPLRRSNSLPKCGCADNNQTEETCGCDQNSSKGGKDSNTKTDISSCDKKYAFNDFSFKKVDNKFYDDMQKIFPNENDYITEKFYNNTLLDQVEIVGNYETQANFVKDLFERSESFSEETYQAKSESKVREDCRCDSEVKCEPGCGCLCDECYSPCWPRDWIKVDYPGARVISINYTSDPYLWRPLWVKESKRLRLHERAEQMMQQLLELGVGEKPIIWVGHSKGGLFIKQMYCEAYEAYRKLHKEEEIDKMETSKRDQLNNNQCSIDNKINHKLESDTDCHVNTNVASKQNDCVTRINNFNEAVNIKNDNEIENNDNDEVDDDELYEIRSDSDNRVYQASKAKENGDKDVNAFKNSQEISDKTNLNDNGNFQEDSVSLGVEAESSNETEDEQVSLRSRLWSRSAGFMFYSVPHRGSPLADIKTPITARSVELMEICKDCSLVVSLQARWSLAASRRPPAVRSLVETCRTLMSVLWLRIVSVDSADPGIGALCGVNVDHREICKPSSRSCLLYKELMCLMHSALKKCDT